MRQARKHPTYSIIIPSWCLLTSCLYEQILISPNSNPPYLLPTYMLSSVSPNEWD
ncbi:hypothetical protein P168DRAFT_289684 [Aspergillus campestris IBT 28561]|uniref:Uncharacterized protein n=1 Tax=Aspergillus campestris (strain IBT 28561) TaxID=1392248 RepID=A0A2I1D4M3_ASPC2|nr:uncharacterized protein P168DRAFT_289684 [Aspergillus campestris IBT 28561]PKY04819.1 hypothetical protein P168DRAFT_289684 [Aspergillus campestris IBT 28561]